AREGDRGRRQSGSGAVVRPDESNFDRQSTRSQADERTGRWAVSASTKAMAAVVAALLVTPAIALGQPSARPAVGPERPFTPPPRVERTLANGLRVIAVRYATVPKVSIVLTVQSG